MQTEGQIASPTRTGREEQLQFLWFWAFFNVFVCHGEQWLFSNIRLLTVPLRRSAFSSCSAVW